MQQTLPVPLIASFGRWGRIPVALAVSAIAVVAPLWFPSRSTIPPSSDLSTERLPALGIEFDYPSNWHLQEFGDSVGLGSLTGALVSNFDHTFEHPDLGPNEGTSAWEMRELPEDVIVISFEQFDRHNFEAKATRGFPLGLEGAVVARDAEHGIDVYGAPQPRFFLPFRVEGHLASGVQVFIGDVDDHDRAVVARILDSVRPFEP